MGRKTKNSARSKIGEDGSTGIEGKEANPVHSPKSAPMERKLEEWLDIVQSAGNSKETSSSKTKWADELEEIPKLSCVGSSVWENFDISKISNAGFKLSYVRPSVEGKQQYMEIEDDDISSKVIYRRNSIVCYVLGAHPSFAVMKGYVQRIWGKLEIDKILMMKNGILVIRFKNEDSVHEVLQGIYHFDNKPLIVKKWSPEMEFSRDELYTAPIWVKLSGLGFKYWSEKSLSKLGSLIGRPLMVDRNTERKVGLSFARLLVEVELDEELPDTITLKNEYGRLMEQKVVYDWRPTLCSTCKKYGHKASECRRNRADKPEVAKIPLGEDKVAQETSKEPSTAEVKITPDKSTAVKVPGRYLSEWASAI